MARRASICHVRLDDLEVLGRWWDRVGDGRKLVSNATDTLPLDGAFHGPDDRVARGGVLLLHGNTMTPIPAPPRWLPPVLTELGFACLAFNRRGHREGDGGRERDASV
jgi:hypothetical protein